MRTVRFLQPACPSDPSSAGRVVHGDPHRAGIDELPTPMGFLRSSLHHVDNSRSGRVCLPHCYLSTWVRKFHSPQACLTQGRSVRMTCYATLSTGTEGVIAPSNLRISAAGS